jgi:hypothetical protein
MTAEEYIKDYTRSYSNELENGEHEYWLTPWQAEEACNLARKQVIDKAIEFVLNSFQCDGSGYTLRYKGILYEPKYIAKDIEKYLNNTVKE